MTTINGLPAHVLLVHLVVVLVPLTALLLVLEVAWPAARRRLSLLTTAVAAAAVIAVPITAEAGEWLEHHLPRTDLMHTHTELGDRLLGWVIGMFVVAAAIAVREFLAERRAANRNYPPAEPGGRPVTAVLAALALVAAVGSAALTVQVGESGARAAWDGTVSAAPAPGPRPAS